MNDLLADLLLDKQTTIPWALDEMLIVDRRWRLVYDADKKNGITLVHLFGRRSTTLAELELAGHEITLPKRIRYGR